MFYDRHSGTASENRFGNPTAPQLVIGSNGTDRLVGGPGCRCSVAGAGKQTMTGMSGADIFVVGQGRINATITDFTAGVDKLQFDKPGKLEQEGRSHSAGPRQHRHHGR